MMENKLIAKTGLNYPPVNEYYTYYGITTNQFLYNIVDVLFFSAFLIALIPFMFFLRRFFYKV